jgi:hypothetical protein
MSQQLGILVMIDSVAAIEARSLDGNIYLIDNAKWAGSTGEGTGHLVTTVDGSRVSGQAETQVLNWLPLGIDSPPPTLPQTFFLHEDARENLSQRSRPAEARALAEGPVAHAAAAPSAEPAPAQPLRLRRKALDILGREVGPAEAHARSFSERAEPAAKAADTKTYYPNPVISNIAGEAVDLRVIYPAQYGSPDLFSDGLYWSATVDTNKVGHFAYILFITLFYSEPLDGKMTECSVTLPYVAYINVTNEIATNGFCTTPAILPV